MVAVVTTSFILHKMMNSAVINGIYGTVKAVIEDRETIVGITDGVNIASMQLSSGGKITDERTISLIAPGKESMKYLTFNLAEETIGRGMGLIP